MPRTIPFAPPEGDDLFSRRPVTIAALELNVITPMFGGGSTPGESDADWPVRPSGILGQLRFWWRACNVRQFETIDQMLEAEAAIWGSSHDASNPASGPGLLNATVRIRNSGNETARLQGPALATFPFRESDHGGRTGIEFALELTAPANATEGQLTGAAHAARQAIWGWITFGGVGSRTRRGCGSLRCMGDVAGRTPWVLAESFIPDSHTLDGVETWIRMNTESLVERGTGVTWDRGILFVPTLFDSVMIAGSLENNANQAWEKAVNPLADFRQGEGVGRNTGKSGGVGARPAHAHRPGQSRWPEPGAIRGLKMMARGLLDGDGHAYKCVPGATGASFPRADLGLPIVFEMERDETRVNLSDYSVTLAMNGYKRTRLASPLLLKPLAVANSKYLPIAVLLTAPHTWDFPPPQLSLKQGNHTIRDLGSSPMNTPVLPWPWKETPPGVVGAVSARNAFLNYLTETLERTRFVL